jgi:gluconokinase
MSLVVIVMGVSGSGKSTLAAALARELDFSFLEGDSCHSEENKRKMSAGIALEDADRWPWLDALSAAIVATRVTARPGKGVVATCSALKRTYRDRIRSAVRPPLLFVYLSVGRETLERRMQNRHGHFMPAALLDSQLKRRGRCKHDRRRGHRRNPTQRASSHRRPQFRLNSCAARSASPVATDVNSSPPAIFPAPNRSANSWRTAGTNADPPVRNT